MLFSTISLFIKTFPFFSCKDINDFKEEDVFFLAFFSIYLPIKIIVNSDDSLEAMNIANSTANYFSKEVKELYNMNNVSILDSAIEASSPYNINILKQLCIYLMLGVVIAFGIIFMIFFGFGCHSSATSAFPDTTKTNFAFIAFAQHKEVKDLPKRITAYISKLLLPFA